MQYKARLSWRALLVPQQRQQQHGLAQGTLRALGQGMEQGRAGREPERAQSASCGSDDDPSQSMVHSATSTPRAQAVPARVALDRVLGAVDCHSPHMLSPSPSPRPPLPRKGDVLDRHTEHT
jgi:hypothetical protein